MHSSRADQTRVSNQRIHFRKISKLPNIETRFLKIKICENCRTITTAYKPQSANTDIQVGRIVERIACCDQFKAENVTICGDFIIYIMSYINHTNALEF